MRVGNLRTPGGREAANQFWIEDGDASYFQSYQSIIVKRQGGRTYLDLNDWDYSRTTGRYRNQYLGEGIEETRRKIESGQYVLTNLN